MFTSPSSLSPPGTLLSCPGLPLKFISSINYLSDESTKYFNLKNRDLQSFSSLYGSNRICTPGRNSRFTEHFPPSPFHECRAHRESATCLGCVSPKPMEGFWIKFLHAADLLSKMFWPDMYRSHVNSEKEAEEEDVDGDTMTPLSRPQNS